jgi:hypothetical protein
MTRFPWWAAPSLLFPVTCPRSIGSFLDGMAPAAGTPPSAGPCSP